MTRRSSWLILRAAAAELDRQAREGLLASCSTLDDSGHIHVAGTIDLARLACALEGGFRREFFEAELNIFKSTGGA